LAAQARELGGSQTGLHGQQQQRMIAPAGPRRAVRRGEQRVDLGLVEVVDERGVEAFLGDAEYPGDQLGLIGDFQCGVAEERVDRG